MMKLRDLIMVLFGLVVLMRCGGTPGASVEFEMIVQSNDLRVPVPNGTHYPNKNPTIMVAISPNEKTALLPLIYQESQVEYQAAIPTDTAFFAVFMGVDQITGAAITVDTMTIADRDIYVVVERDLGKQRLTESAGTRSPFQVVSIPTSRFPIERPVRVHLIDNDSGEEIATTEYPAP